MLKFDLYSDIHLDHWDSYGFEIEEYIPTQKSDNLIIAGDIATTLSNKNEKVSKLFSVLSNKYDQIFIVLGNHDYWGGELLTEASLTQERYSNVTVLNNSSVVIPEYNLRILGATMWSNISPPLYNYIANRMNDYNYIKCNNRRATVQNTVTAVQAEGAATRQLIQNNLITELQTKLCDAKAKNAALESQAFTCASNDSQTRDIINTILPHIVKSTAPAA